VRADLINPGLGRILGTGRIARSGTGPGAPAPRPISCTSWPWAGGDWPPSAPPWLWRVPPGSRHYIPPPMAGAQPRQVHLRAEHRRHGR